MVCLGGKRAGHGTIPLKLSDTFGGGATRWKPGRRCGTIATNERLSLTPKPFCGMAAFMMHLLALTESGGLSAALAAQVVCGLAGLVLLAAMAGVWLVRGSTAVPAAWWAVAAAAVAALDALRQTAGAVSPASAATGRVAVAALLVCPIMSLLGAKRPQHGVWQLIVATLAVVLALPAASALLIRPGSFPDLHILARCFLPLLLLVGWMNFIGTQRAVAASLVTLGQLGLIWPLLPGVDLAVALPQPTVDVLAALAIAAGSLLAVGQSLAAGRSRVQVATVRQGRFAERIDGCLLPLRETLGAAWTLRLAERFAAIAEQRGWPVRLTFRGADVGGDPADTAWQRDATRAAEALFRRFVSVDWLRRHGWPMASADPAIPGKRYRDSGDDGGTPADHAAATNGTAGGW